MAKQQPKQQPEPKPAEATVEGTPEPYHPMAVPEPSTEDRVEALEFRIKVLEENVTRHNRYHFGQVSK